MWPFKSKFDKLKREDVVDAICNLEKQESDLESAIEERARTIEELLAKGRKESNRELKLFYAKKITTLREENQTDVQRAMYLMYNTKLLRKLKTTIDDNEFFVRTGKVSLGNLLADQKGLAQFLNKALGTKVRSEQVLTAADDTWNEVQSANEANGPIHGENEHDDELLAMFETGEQLEGELQSDGAAEEQKQADADRGEN